MNEAKPAELMLEIRRDLAVELCRATEPRIACRQLLEAAMRLPGIDCGAAFACGPDSGALQLLSHHGISEESAKALRPAADDPLLTALADGGKPVHASRDDLPPEVAAALAVEGLRTLVIVPVKSAERLIGLVMASSHRQARIGVKTRLALEGLVTQAEGVIALLCERESWRRNGHELRLVADQHTARLGMAMEAAGVGSWSWEVAEGAVWTDCRTMEMFGFASSNPISIPEIVASLHPGDRERYLADLAAAIESDNGSVWSHEYRIIHPRDGERWVFSLGCVERDAMGRGVGATGINADITEHKRIAKALRESDEKYRKLHESMMDAYASVDMAGRVLDSNRVFREMLGYTAEELSRLTYRDLTPEKWHEFEADLVAGQILLHGASEVYEKEYRRKDGPVFPVELRTFLLRDGEGAPASMWAIVRDISARKQAERALRELNETLEQRVAARTLALAESESRFRQLAEATFEGIVISEGGIVTVGNTRLGELYGCPVEEIIGCAALDFVAPESRALVGRLMREGRVIPYEFTAMRKDGTTFPAEAHGRNRTSGGRKLRVTAVRDLTSAKQATEQIQAQRAQLEQARYLALKDEISTGVLHQIVQPLTAATNHSAAAKHKASCCESQACSCLPLLDKITDDLGRTRQTIVRIRALAHPGHWFRSRIDLNALVLGLEDLLREEAMVQGFEIGCHYAADLPAVEVDRVQIEQVVFNLVRNAFEAGSELTPLRRVVRVSTHVTADDGVELRICDRGCGIAVDSQALLFTAFFTTKTNGTGIGLRLSQTIIATHGGSIEGFNNTDGPGATFRFSLPAAPADS